MGGRVYILQIGVNDCKFKIKNKITPQKLEKKHTESEKQFPIDCRKMRGDI